MKFEPKIKSIADIKLVGKRIKMSLTNNKTRELWQGFMPRLKEVKNNIGTELYSVEIYDNSLFFKNFNPANVFEKWAAIRVEDFNSVPAGMEAFEVPKGEYAVFNYKGKASDAPKIYQYIFGNWIPNSDFVLDDRPHFAVMGEKYKNEDPDSEEELWVPILKKSQG